MKTNEELIESLRKLTAAMANELIFLLEEQGRYSSSAQIQIMADLLERLADRIPGDVIRDEHGPAAPSGELENVAKEYRYSVGEPRDGKGCAGCGGIGGAHFPGCMSLGRTSELFDPPGADPETIKARHAVFASVRGQPFGGQRLYLPTLAELIDRLSIVQLKQIFISEHAEAYAKERADIEHDIDILLASAPRLDAKAVHAIMMVMLTNRVIWESESRARQGETQDLSLLKFSHSINGSRNTAKNVIAVFCGERKDHKIDALAADLPAEYGNWAIWK